MTPTRDGVRAGARLAIGEFDLEAAALAVSADTGSTFGLGMEPGWTATPGGEAVHCIHLSVLGWGQSPVCRW